MKEKLIDDFAGMVGGALGLLADVRDQVRGDMRDRMKGVADRIDLVTRDEMQMLERRLAAIESLLMPKSKPTTKPKPKAKMTPSKKKAKR